MMHLHSEDLVLTRMSERLDEARAQRRAAVLVRAQRAAKRAERKALQARLLLDRIL
jgi:hypothetical protein